jgi:hypothetical protein
VAPIATGSVAEQSGAMLGFETKLWLAADKLRNNMDAAEYKHVVLGLIFLKYISDAFEERYAALDADKKSGADPEDPDEYRADNIFWVPKDARWSHLQGKAKQPTIGKLLDDAMVSISSPPIFWTNSMRHYELGEHVQEEAHTARFYRRIQGRGGSVMSAAWKNTARRGDRTRFDAQRSVEMGSSGQGGRSRRWHGSVDHLGACGTRSLAEGESNTASGT